MKTRALQESKNAEPYPMLYSRSFIVLHLPLHALAIVNNHEMNMEMGVFLQDPDFNFFREILRSGFAGSYGGFICCVL